MNGGVRETLCSLFHYILLCETKNSALHSPHLGLFQSLDSIGVMSPEPLTRWRKQCNEPVSIEFPYPKSGEDGRELDVPLTPPFIIHKKHLYPKVGVFLTRIFLFTVTLPFMVYFSYVPPIFLQLLHLSAGAVP